MKERLVQIAEYMKMSIRAFESECNLQRGNISNMSETGAIGSDKMSKIFARFPDLNLEWLLTGDGVMFKSQNSLDNQSSLEKVDDEQDTLGKQPVIYNFQSDYFNINKQIIPLYEIEASAGLNLLFGNQSNQVPVDYISVPNAPKCDGAMFVRGDSMYPIMKSGDIICYKHISDLQNNLRFGEIYLLYINDGDDEYLTVKYLQVSERGSDYIKLVSQNKYHAPKDEHLSHILGAAIVKLSIRYNTIS